MKALNILVMALALVVTACGGNDREKRSSVRVATGDSGVIPGNGVPATGPGTTFQALWGTLNGWSETEIRNLLSASNSQGELQGAIAGVALAGDIRVDGTNDIRGATGGSFNINNQSRFRLDICDSVSQTQGCLQIGFSSANNPQSRISGQIYNGGNTTIVMADQYGAIRLQGQYNSSEHTGTAYYCNGPNCQNNSNSFRPLGQYRVPTCGFFHCGN
jgi:hypothetical protein